MLNLQMKTPLLLILVLSSVCCYNFEDYIAQFNKSYASNEQYAFRQAMFETNYSLIEEFNSKDNGFTLGVNNMTDWTQTEVDSLLTLRRDPQVKVSQFSEKRLRVSAAVQINWNTSGKVSPAKDQGRCGSCWAFATVATYESYLAIKTGMLLDLSEQYVVECTNQSNCIKGGFLNYAFETITKRSPAGLPLQSQYPYTSYGFETSNPLTPNICSTTSKRYAKAVSNFYANVTVEQMKGLLTASPVAAMVWASPEFMSYKAGSIRCSSIAPPTLNHIVQVVGYDSNGNWIVKNSWGKLWGIKGFAYVSQAADCGMKVFVAQFSGTNHRNSNAPVKPAKDDNDSDYDYNDDNDDHNDSSYDDDDDDDYDQDNSEIRLAFLWVSLVLALICAFI